MLGDMAKHRKNRRSRRGAAMIEPRASMPPNAPPQPPPLPETHTSGHATSAPRCVACFPGSRPGRPVPLGYGVTLVLCKEHRDPRFIVSAPGRELLATIRELYVSLGLTARRYGEALSAFVRACAGPPTPSRHRPGSYAHPFRRRSAERVWAAGGTFEAGLAAALANGPPDKYHVNLPARRTVYRWWLEARRHQVVPELVPAA